MDFTLSPEVEEMRLRIRDFVDREIIPLESDRANYDEHENIAEAPLERLKAKAKAEGLWSLSLPVEDGGLGYSVTDITACYEEMNRSIFGPVCFNASAPDDGNMRILSQIARPDQKEKWLVPIANGDVRSSFVMTEPMPGSGSDPADNRRGLSAFMFHADQPGWKIIRRIPIMGPEEHGGHCEIAFDGLEIPDADRLMEVGDGLKLTQMRLGTARLTHCMRWLGLSRPAMEIARDYVQQRVSFGSTLAEHEGVQWMMGEVAMGIEVGRLLTMRAARRLDEGDFARKEVSMAKIQVADTLHQAVDTAIQLNGARGYSKDTVLEWIYRYARQARLVDGASEVHKMVLARNYLAEGNEFWSWK